MNIAAMAQRETDAEKALAAASAILVVDWPSRDVPDTLARSGLADEGPGNYRRYDVHGGAVQVRTLAHAPERVDIVYAHRPVDELSEIVLTAKQLAATTVWIQSGRDSGGRKEPTGCWLAPGRLPARSRDRRGRRPALRRRAVHRGCRTFDAIGGHRASRTPQHTSG